MVCFKQAAVLFAIAATASGFVGTSDGSWGNVLGNREDLPLKAEEWEGGKEVMAFVQESINEHWGRCRQCSHVGNLRITGVQRARRQLMTFSDDGKDAFVLKMRAWDGNTTEEPLLLGVVYEFDLTTEFADEPPVSSPFEKRVAAAYKAVQHHVSIQGDREALFSLVRHTWEPAAGALDATLHGASTGVLSTWFGFPEDQAAEAALCVICYNIWNFNNPWNHRLLLIVNGILEGPTPDILAFQEVRYDNIGSQLGPESTRHQVDHLLWRLEQVGLYQVAWVPAMTYFQGDRGLAVQTEGPAIFTRLPVLHVEALPLTRYWPEDSGDEHQRVCLSVTVATEQLGNINILTSHLTLSESARMSNVYEMCRFAQELESKPNGGKITLLMGDLNMVDSDPAMQFLLGQKEYKGTTCDFRDIWTMGGDRKHELGLANGNTFNNLKKVEKRIDFILVRGPVEDAAFPLMEVFGSRERNEDNVPPSDHMGLRLLAKKLATTSTPVTSDEL